MNKNRSLSYSEGVQNQGVGNKVLSGMKATGRFAARISSKALNVASKGASKASSGLSKLGKKRRSKLERHRRKKTGKRKSDDEGLATIEEEVSTISTAAPLAKRSTGEEEVAFEPVAAEAA